MNTRTIKILAAVLIILAVAWMGFMTYKFYKFDKVARELQVQTMRFASMPSIAADLRVNAAKIGDKYSYADVDAFTGRLLASLNEGKLLVISGSARLNQNAIKEGAGAIPMPIEIKYIHIDDNTKLIGSKDKPFDIAGLKVNDMLVIKTSDSTDLGSAAFTASSVMRSPAALQN